MARARTRTRKSDGQMQFGAMQVGPTTAPCVPALKEAVEAWHDNGYKGATGTTKELLNYWLKSDHRQADDSLFSYRCFQREAIETLIYRWEVQRIRSRKELLECYAPALDISLPAYDDFVRLAIKMATGSGKTKVMSLVIAWQYLNAVREENPEYAKTFLLIAPNVIVFERLKTDFERRRIFQTDPIIPKHMRTDWDFDCVMRGDGERAATDGILFLTNIHQLYER